MDYEETLLVLDSIVGAHAIVYPAEAEDRGEDPQEVFSGSGLLIAGRFRRDHDAEQASAVARRQAMVTIPPYREMQPDLDLGDDAPLERYERQAAHFTFEGMDERDGLEPRDDSLEQAGYAGFSLWRHEFVQSQWLAIPVRPDWLWIRTGTVGLVVVAEFPGAPAVAGD